MLPKEVSHFSLPDNQDDEQDLGRQTIYDRRMLGVDFSAYAQSFIDTLVHAPANLPARENAGNAAEAPRYSRDENFLPRTFADFLRNRSLAVVDLLQHIFASEKEAESLLEADITPANITKLEQLYHGPMTDSERRQLKFLRRAYGQTA